MGFVGAFYAADRQHPHPLIDIGISDDFAAFAALLSVVAMMIVGRKSLFF